ncbi:MAG: Rieske (2Fe-2S) protein [Spirosomataceae bacterium]
MKTNQPNEQESKIEMTRGEFLRSLGLSSATLMAYYCMGTLTSCSKSSDPSPSGSTATTTSSATSTSTVSNSIDFTVDLTTDLKKNGDYIYKGNVIVARTSTGTFVALSKICTHEGTTVEFQSNDTLKCPNHGSVFTSTGAVSNGPAAAPLKVYKTELKENNTKLRVYE